MTLILCPADTIAETIRIKIAAGYRGLTCAVHMEEVGLHGHGFFPAWRSVATQAPLTLVASDREPFPYPVPASLWLRDRLDHAKDNAA